MEKNSNTSDFIYRILWIWVSMKLLQNFYEFKYVTKFNIIFLMNQKYILSSLLRHCSKIF